MSTLDSNWKSQAMSPAEVMKHLKSGDRVFIHGAAATPTPLLDAMVDRRDLHDVQLYHLHLAGPCAFTDPERGKGFFSNSLFIGAPLRKPIEEGRADFMPIFLSDIPCLFSSGRIPLDVAVLQLSPPDAQGNCTLGTSVDAAKAAAESARIVLAEINVRMPRTHGNTVVPFSSLKAFTLTDRPLHEHEPAVQSSVERRIGEIVAELIEDGSTLQMGIGAIPDAVLSRLGDKNDLGIHTEMFSDGIIPLVENGNVTNKYKEIHRGRTVTSFLNGTQKLYDFVNDNLLVEMHPCDRTNDTSLIRRNPKVCAINAAIEIDLTGQVCADSMGCHMYSGIGGQMDFVRGAALSKGGRAIIALPSTAAKGTVSRITAQLKPGAGVVTTRGHVHYVATEYGVVNLHGLNLKQRAEALISIAHPDFRGELRRQVSDMRHFTFS